MRFHTTPYFLSCIETPSGITYYTSSDRSIAAKGKFQRPPKLNSWLRCFKCKQKCLPHCIECSDSEESEISISMKSSCNRKFEYDNQSFKIFMASGQILGSTTCGDAKTIDPITIIYENHISCNEIFKNL